MLQVVARDGKGGEGQRTLLFTVFGALREDNKPPMAFPITMGLVCARAVSQRTQNYHVMAFVIS